MKLSPKEYELLRLLVQHAGKVLTHKFLLKELWSTPASTRNISASMSGSSGTRSSPIPARPQYILTETGIGYRLKAPD